MRSAGSRLGGRRQAVQHADILVGVPVYKDGPMVTRCLDSLVEAGVQLLVVDNGSTSAVKRAIKGRGIIICNAVNRYVNPAWNQMMEFFQQARRYDLLAIANSDLILDPGWAQRLRDHCKRCPHEQIICGFDGPRQRSSLGSFFAMTPRAIAACLPIPEDLLVMGGDDFIFNVALGVGCEKHILTDLTMTHVERGTYDKSPEVWDIARRDTDRWNRHGLTKLVPQRVADFLAREHA
jgi:hypothetical protein